jgi:hypothetical protein
VVSHEAPFLKHRACTLERSRAACFSWPLRAKLSVQTVAKKRLWGTAFGRFS